MADKAKSAKVPDVSDLPVILEDLEVFQEAGLEFLIFRVNPKPPESTGEPYCGKFGRAFTYDDVQRRFGGGVFRCRPKKDSKFHGPSFKFEVEGLPLIPSAVEVDDPPAEAAQLGDPSGLLALLLQKLETSQRELIEALRAPSQVVAKRDPYEEVDVFKAKVAAAQEARLLQMALEPAPKNDFDAMRVILEAVSIGADMNPGQADTGSMLGNVALQLLQRLSTGRSGPGLASASGGRTAPKAEAVPVPNSDGMPDAAVPARDDVVPGQGAAMLSRTVPSFGGEPMETIEDRVVLAADTIVQAVEAVSDYSDEDMADFVVQVLRTEDLPLLKGHLTFDKLRLTCEGDPGLQIKLDTYRGVFDRVLGCVAQRMESINVVK